MKNSYSSSPQKKKKEERGGGDVVDVKCVHRVLININSLCFADGDSRLRIHRP